MHRLLGDVALHLKDHRVGIRAVQHPGGQRADAVAPLGGGQLHRIPQRLGDVWFNALVQLPGRAQGVPLLAAKRVRRGDAGQHPVGHCGDGVDIGPDPAPSSLLVLLRSGVARGQLLAFLGAHLGEEEIPPKRVALVVQKDVVRADALVDDAGLVQIGKAVVERQQVLFGAAPALFAAHLLQVLLQRLQRAVLADHIDGGVLLDNLQDGQQALVVPLLPQRAVQVLKAGAEIFKLGRAPLQRLQGIRAGQLLAVLRQISPHRHLLGEKFLDLHHVPQNGILRQIDKALHIFGKFFHNAVLADAAALA